MTWHIFNGRAEDPDSGHCHAIHSSSNWDPFRKIETSDFFYTYLYSSDDHYTIDIFIPNTVSRKVILYKETRILTIYALVVARRAWHDFSVGRDNVHELWRTYVREFRIPKDVDYENIRADYYRNAIQIRVWRRPSRLQRTLSWVEGRLKRRSSLGTVQ
ncbi:hypothetical protein FBU59_000917 [Linderina macrospora]|uniref:Uncharacterized protein n=1 Tax=Linderina macrospora TaxID=4868 RepID=A0ACC1JFI0_9FUNG|nr:hypothetical protein FBU59_000917 [Linderina macrospora]